FSAARAGPVPAESGPALASLVWSHFLRRTAAHFAGKCSKNLCEMIGSDQRRVMSAPAAQAREASPVSSSSECYSSSRLRTPRFRTLGFRTLGFRTLGFRTLGVDMKVILAAVIAASIGIGSAAAQSYPSKMVTIIVPAAAGGLTDTLTRMVAQKLSQKW